MSTDTSTATLTATEFTLTPPDPVPVVAPEQAAGLVPVTTEQKSKLDTKVDAFVNELVTVDANSPQFGEKVDQITRMGQEQIRAAAAMSNRFLDRPVRAMDGDGSVGKDLAELRRTVEDLDPGRQGKLSGPRKILGIIPFGNKLKNYFGTFPRSCNASKAARRNSTSIMPRSIPNARSCGRQWASWNR